MGPANASISSTRRWAVVLVPALAGNSGAGSGLTGDFIVTEHQETSEPGVWAAGDVVRGLNQISVATGEAAIAATAIHHRLAGRNS